VMSGGHKVDVRVWGPQSISKSWIISSLSSWLPLSASPLVQTLDATPLSHVKICFSGCLPLPPHVLPPRPPNVTHMSCLFFTALLLPCIIVSTNRTMKNWVGLGMKLWCRCRYALYCHSNEVILSDISVCM